MRSLLLPLSLLASAAIGALASDDLKIDVTLPVECERKTQKGDKIQVHYRGALQSNGQQFDASESALVRAHLGPHPPPHPTGADVHRPHHLGYDRGTPLSFMLGVGKVIKGWDEGLLDMCIGEKRTLTIGPSYGYGQRNVGPIPAGSTLGKQHALSGPLVPGRQSCRSAANRIPAAVFETELVGIDGVPKPESIVSKSATDSAASSASQNVAEKVASAASDAAEAVKTVVGDTDDDQEHKEL